MPINTTLVVAFRVLTDLPSDVLWAVIDGLTVPVMLFTSGRRTHENRAARSLRARLLAEHRTDIDIVIRAHIREIAAAGEDDGQHGAMITAKGGEPLQVYVQRLRAERVVVSIRTLAPHLEASRQRFGLSRREAEIARLVVFGYSTRDISITLQIAPATAKKHLTRVFDKVGVNSRSQLQAQLS